MGPPPLPRRSRRETASQRSNLPFGRCDRVDGLRAKTRCAVRQGVRTRDHFAHSTPHHEPRWRLGFFLRRRRWRMAVPHLPHAHGPRPRRDHHRSAAHPALREDQNPRSGSAYCFRSRQRRQLDSRSSDAFVTATRRPGRVARHLLHSGNRRRPRGATGSRWRPNRR